MIITIEISVKEGDMFSILRSVGEKMNKRRYSNRRRKNILRVFILLMTIIITVVMWRTIKIDVQVGELTELSNGKKVDSRIYPELQQMFNDARAEGLALFVREGYRTPIRTEC